MNTTQIAELLQPFLIAGRLYAEQLDLLSRYLDLLLRWNARTNLTAVRDEINIVIRHFGESLFAAARLLGSASVSGSTPDEARGGVDEKHVRKAMSVVDVGSGAGFPGLPIKIYSPELKLTLIESQNKKATFLKEVIRTLRLGDVSVYSGRAESCGIKADLVTLRAVEQFERVVAVAAGLVRHDEKGGAGTGLLSGEDSLAEAGKNSGTMPINGGAGRLALLIGATQHESARKALPHFCWENPILIPLSSERILLVGWPGAEQR